jgi:anti-anti-sigma factor
VSTEEALTHQRPAERIIIELPGEIDVTNSPAILETLLAASSEHPATVIIDMTSTTFCDSSGMRALLLSYRRATASGTDMRLAVKHPAVRRVFELNGIDTIIDIHPDLPAALAA